MRTGSAGLDKKRCKIIIDKRYGICESGAGEDVKHLLLKCGEFEGGYWLR